MSHHYVTAADPPTVAHVYDREGALIDRCYSWEAGQNYALHDGMRVVAVADDGFMLKDDAQALYDSERDRFFDCWGIEPW